MVASFTHRFPSRQYIAHTVHHLWGRVEAGDVLEVSCLRAGMDGVETKEGYVAVLHEGEIDLDGRLEWEIGFSRIAPSLSKIELLAGTTFRRGNRDLELVSQGDKEGDPKWIVTFPAIVFPHLAEDIGLQYRLAVERGLFPEI